jgi:hypothetical protein
MPSVNINKGLEDMTSKSEKDMAYQARHPEKIRSIKARYFQSVRGKYIQYKAAAKRRSLVFQLTLEQFKEYWGLPCSYCGADIRTIGLDREDNARGYEVDNVVPCCARCNMAKASMTTDEYLDHCARVTKFRGEKRSEL